MRARRELGRPAAALVALVLGGLVLGAAVLPAPLAAGAAPAKTSTATSPTPDLTACVASKKAVSVVFVVDESRSLKQTDPSAARVTAATYLVNQWAQGVATRGVTVSLAVTGFGQSPDPVLGWTTVTAGALPTLQPALESFKNRNTGTGTDYWLALDDARRSLASRPGRQPGDCQAIVWFSDGKLDTAATYASSSGRTVRKPYVGPSVSSDKDATTAAATDLCRDGGLADQVRSSQITTFGIGLQVGGQAADFDLMKGVSTGAVVAGAPCGRIHSPVPGVFHLASDVDGLLALFNDIIIGPPTVDLCPASPCAGERQFVLDASINSVHLFGGTLVEGAGLRLRAPDGKSVDLPRGVAGTTPVTVGTARGTVEWLGPKTVSVDLVPTSTARTGGWSGQWGLQYLRDAKPVEARLTTLQISSDISPRWDQKSTFSPRAGQKSSPVTFGLTTPKSPIKATDLLGSVRFNASVIDSAGTSIPVVSGVGKDGVDVRRTLDLTTAKQGAAKVRVTLELTTGATTVSGKRIAGTALAPQSIDLPFTIRPPVGSATLVTDRLDFGEIQTAADVTRTIAFEGPGCVWLPADATTVAAAPKAAGAVAVSSTANTPASCLRLAEGQRAQLPITLTSESAANGAITGTVELATAPVDELGRVQTVTLPFQASLAKPVDVITRTWAFIVCLLVGILLPLLFLYLVKWRSARIPPLTLQAEAFPVTRRGDQVLRNGLPFDLGPRDLRRVVQRDAGARRLEVEGVQLRTSTGWSPFGPGSVTASREAALMASSSHGAGAARGSATLPLAVHQCWLLVLPNGSGDAAQIVVFVGPDPAGDVRQRVAQDIRERAPQQWQALVTEDATDDWTGTGPGGPGDAGDHPWADSDHPTPTLPTVVGSGAPTGTADQPPDFSSFSWDEDT
ncbi:VWA domain-containing protein [Dermatophilaceae bacterium Soc4.6]